MSLSPEFPKYLNVGKVSDILGLSSKWVYLHKEEVPGFLRIGKAILFDADILYKELKRLSSQRRINTL